MSDPVFKAVASEAGDDPLDYVMSDATVDRYGDSIVAEGWKLTNFRKNPVALFGHNSNFVIGHWKNVRVEGGKLLGRLELLGEGISERLDEIRAAVAAGVLRAVSVGFRPLAADPMPGGKGAKFTSSELVECSLVAIPANPNALQLAKSLNLSDDVQRMIFGEPAEGVTPILRRDGTGKSAKSPPFSRNTKMPTLAERIETAQTEIVELKDKLADETRADDVDATVIEALTTELETKEATLASLRRAEAALSKSSTSVVTDERRDQQQNEQRSERRPFAMPAKKVAPKDYVLRSAVATALGHVLKRNPADVLLERYGDDAVTRAVFDVVTRAASAPATTTTTGWAAELVQTAILDFIESLLPLSVYPGLSERGGRFTFGRNGIVSLPARNTGNSVGGSFVGQGAPIPVRQGAFTSTSLTPKKMAVISTFTREIAQHSTPSIEAVLREAIQEDTAVAIDTVLLDATAASAVRPAGLRNGVTATTATSGGGFAALVGDLKALIAALIASSNGRIRQPVWIMNPIQVLSASVTQNAGGDFPFKAEIAEGNLLGYPILQSTTVAAGMVFLVDAADFFSATGDDPVFDMSDQATLHMEDTTPLAIGTTGTPNTVAAPVRSLFQTDTLALRMILDMNWAMRRTGTVAWTQSVTW
ncbi:phage major capsid protein [Sphingobium phenoxybenzoativorans]|uniref:Phage major capsid protein n=1 Tax=Sphingobium phenoxybenzoativorans TaxID=1592790 RepID=A0A975Q3D2_9SPHN|nr:phage major capsid protein [Sphingobium phenoxybenzoativorans]QUT07930.1 phage major capsid protein [Sphingobium phenoxybenzoativorans]